MNLGHLEIFHAVAEAGSLSRGAERLYISQPAVSKQVADLERSVGAPLLVRGPKGVRLTEAGEVLAAYARRLFAVEAEAERALRELRGLERGRLAIGASRTIGVYLLPELLGAFHRRYAGVELRLEIDNTERVQQQLCDYTLDLGLTEGFVRSPELEAEVFAEDELVVVAAPDHPLTCEERVTAAMLCAAPLILREEGSGTRAVMERALAERGLAPRPVMCLNSTEAIKRAVGARIGLAIVSRLAVEDELVNGRLVLLPLADLTIRRPLHRLRRRDGSASPAARAFWELLVTTDR